MVKSTAKWSNQRRSGQINSRDVIEPAVLSRAKCVRGRRSAGTYRKTAPASVTSPRTSVYHVRHTSLHQAPYNPPRRPMHPLRHVPHTSLSPPSRLTSHTRRECGLRGEGRGGCSQWNVGICAHPFHYVPASQNLHSTAATASPPKQIPPPFQQITLLPHQITSPLSQLTSLLSTDHVPPRRGRGAPSRSPSAPAGAAESVKIL